MCALLANKHLAGDNFGREPDSWIWWAALMMKRAPNLSTFFPPTLFFTSGKKNIQHIWEKEILSIFFYFITGIVALL